MISFIKIKCKIESFEPDPAQYKPGKPLLRPTNLYVDVNVPVKYLAADPSDKTGTHLTLEGFHKLTKVLIGLEKF